MRNILVATPSAMHLSPGPQGLAEQVLTTTSGHAGRCPATCSDRPKSADLWSELIFFFFLFFLFCVHGQARVLRYTRMPHCTLCLAKPIDQGGGVRCIVLDANGRVKSKEKKELVSMKSWRCQHQATSRWHVHHEIDASSMIDQRWTFICHRSICLLKQWKHMNTLFMDHVSYLKKPLPIMLKWTSSLHDIIGNHRRTCLFRHWIMIWPKWSQFQSQNTEFHYLCE